MKNLLLGFFTLSLTITAFAETEGVSPKLTKILRTGVTQIEAESICRDKGMRLPTARELALLAESLGAQGISKTSKKGYLIVEGADSAGNPDYFYFNDNGYTPAGDMGNYFLWSSSFRIGDSDNAYYMNGYYGFFPYVERSYNGEGANIESAVRCVVE